MTVVCGILVISSSDRIRSWRSRFADSKRLRDCIAVWCRDTTASKETRLTVSLRCKKTEDNNSAKVCVRVQQKVYYLSRSWMEPRLSDICRTLSAT